ncbi:MAG: AAA family ATPase [Nocardioides sp.]|nr:AAA family ATPase [Nocardioides sp.]
MVAEVWLVTGAQASGKSTVADLLARQFERGVHVRGGQFYLWVVKGWVAFDNRQQPHEARRLLELRYRLSALTAVEYASAGFTCVVQDNIYGDDIVRWVEAVRPLPTHLVVLRPRVAVVAARDEARRLGTGKVAYRDGFTPELNDAQVATTPGHLGLWLDNSDQEPDETTAEILARSTESLLV